MAKKKPVKRLIVRVQHKRLNGRGFGAYMAGSAKRGESRILVDLDALAWAAVADGTSGAFKRSVIDTVGHEFMHALEDIFGLMFNEKRIEAAIKKARHG